MADAVHMPRRRAWWQGALAALALGGLLLGVALLLAAGPINCDTIPDGREYCLLATVPPADFSGGQLLDLVGGRRGRLPAERPHISPVPAWWVHTFYRIVLPVQGWQLVWTSGSRGPNGRISQIEAFTRPGATLNIVTSNEARGYHIVVSRRPAA